jgi:uncharacterized membrane protein YsdA (DUF1294 family)/cold shock CspA family protein
MRFEGTLKTWNDDRGFGFIEPTQGGQEIFAHAKAFKSRAGRPQAGQRVTFEVELGPQGKKRAKNVEVRLRTPARKARPPSRSQWGGASLFAIPAFLLLYFGVALAWHVPAWVGALYLGASVLCLLVYAADKSAAVAGRWRVAESTLLTLGLVGGWPGALLAQQMLRHKSSKPAFRSAFWATVVVNVAVFVACASPFAN